MEKENAAVLDVILQNPYLFMGSRLKRISERFLNDAIKIHHAHGFDIYPAQAVILAQIEQLGEIAVAQLAHILRLTQPGITRALNGLRDMGLVETRAQESDNRVRLVSLTPKGAAVLSKLKAQIWPKVACIVQEMFEQIDPHFAKKLSEIENLLDEKSFENRFIEMKNTDLDLPKPEVRILDYSPEFAKDFYELNVAWIRENFIVEKIDEEVLSKPDENILLGGGAILLAQVNGIGIVGTCALMNMGDGWWELTKMCVRQDLRGLKIGEKLFTATLEKAKQMGIEKLFLLTNAKQEAAIKLYETRGFSHSKMIMEKFGAEYERCNVAMIYEG